MKKQQKTVPKTQGINTETKAIDKDNTTQNRQFRKVKWLKAGILNQARRRPHKIIQRPLLGGKIITTLIKLKGSGLAESLNANV